MTKETVSNWRNGIAINLVSSLFAFLVGVVVAYFEHAGSIWVKPILFGFLAWLLTFCSIIVYRLYGLIPARPEYVTHDNLESFIRNWLDRYSMTVQKQTNKEDHFNFLVTTTGGKKVSVRRNTHFPDYLNFSALITLTEYEKVGLATITVDEKSRAIYELKLELSRAAIGMTPDKATGGFRVFKDLPVTRTLSESQFFDALWKIEAVVNSALSVNALTAIRLRSEGKIKAEDKQLKLN